MAVLLGSLSATVLPGTEHPSSVKTFTYHRFVAFGMIWVREGANDYMAGLDASSDFFENLRWKRKGDQVTFLKDGNVVLNYPAEFVLNVRFTGSYRPTNDAPTGPYDILDNVKRNCLSRAELESWVNQHHFELHWKRNLEMRPVELLSPYQRRGASPAPTGCFGEVFTARVASAQVPLTDHLVLSLFDSEDKLIGRRSRGLDAPPVDFHFR